MSQKRKLENLEVERTKKCKIQHTDQKTNQEVSELWSEHQLIAELHDLPEDIAKNITYLLKEGNTIPFIARYRRNLTGNLSVEKLKDVKEAYEKILFLKAKSKTILKSLQKSGNLTNFLQKVVLGAKTLEELEHIYAPFKPGNKKTLFEKAKSLGLEEPALKLLENSEPVDLNYYVSDANEELKSLENVEKGIVHIIAHVIATDTEVLEYLRKIRTENYFIIETKKSSSKQKNNKESKSFTVKNQDEKKYELYYSFQTKSNFIKPHQILAINRGESQKVLSVKIIIPNFIYDKFKSFCFGRFIKRGAINHRRKSIIETAIEDAYNRLVQPLIIREVRSELKSKAEKASLEVFTNNLKQILLAKPIKGKSILGIDPGYKNGCKIALISPTGTVLETDVIHPFKSLAQKSAEVIKKILISHNCTLIAIGNGTACRETESWISDLIKRNVFTPLKVVYTIVDENGASIYSCSPEAKKEFPEMDPNLISAVSLARRVQNPLAELVKVEPKHLGVGMYQHDLPKKQLETSLDDVVTECVSFVGVDLNTASKCLLKKIAGLHEKKASAIVDYREKNGYFANRLELKKVASIGAKVFEQCAGFLRVEPNSEDFYKNPKTNRLDRTDIHPESYEVCEKILNKFNLFLEDVGKCEFIQEMKTKRHTTDVTKLSKELNTPKETVEFIIDCLCKPLNFDMRTELDSTPLFKESMTNIDDLKIGSVLTGRVTNVTHFGCFVDIGVGINGLIHSSKQNNVNLQIGDKVEVKVLTIEVTSKRIGLQLSEKLVIC